MTTIKWEQLELTLTEEPNLQYDSDIFERKLYTAQAEDVDGHGYAVFWDLQKGAELNVDKPTKVKRLSISAAVQRDNNYEVDMYFKSDYHREIFEELISRFNSHDRYYVGFAYVASATHKETITKVASDHELDYEKLIEMSGVWSNSERAMIELAYQMYNGGNLYYDYDDRPEYSTVHDIFRSLDEDNTRVATTAITMKYA